MNENLNLVEILKDCPEGTKLYSPIYGDVELVEVLRNEEEIYPIEIKISDYSTDRFSKDGKIYYDGECTLFPSREQRDWGKFNPKKPKFDPKTLCPFDKILVRDSDECRWRCGFYSHTIENDKSSFKYVATGSSLGNVCCIPYNDDTEHLVGTTEEAPEFYRYWEE